MKPTTPQTVTEWIEQMRAAEATYVAALKACSACPCLRGDACPKWDEYLIARKMLFDLIVPLGNVGTHARLLDVVEKAHAMRKPLTSGRFNASPGQLAYELDTALAALTSGEP